MVVQWSSKSQDENIWANISSFVVSFPRLPNRISLIIPWQDYILRQGVPFFMTLVFIVRFVLWKLLLTYHRYRGTVDSCIITSPLQK